MQTFVIHENIERFRRLIARETGADRLAILTRLLAEEQLRLADDPTSEAQRSMGRDDCV